ICYALFFILTNTVAALLYPLSLHDALPISFAQQDLPGPSSNIQTVPAGSFVVPMDNIYQSIVPAGQAPFNLKAYGLINAFLQNRSEEHTSELQSRENLVCCLLLKKNKHYTT